MTYQSDISSKLDTIIDNLNSMDNIVDIAHLLHDKGIKGARRNYGHCPLANYIKAELDLPDMISVYVWSTDTNLGYGDEWGREAFHYNEYSETSPISRFIDSFDHGRFSYLDTDFSLPM